MNNSAQLAPPLPWGDYVTPECREETNAWLLVNRVAL